jgi:hypothetical protein
MKIKSIERITDGVDLVFTVGADSICREYLRVKERYWLVVHKNDVFEEMYQEYIKKEK